VGFSMRSTSASELSPSDTPWEMLSQRISWQVFAYCDTDQVRRKAYLELPSFGLAVWVSSSQELTAPQKNTKIVFEKGGVSLYVHAVAPGNYFISCSFNGKVRDSAQYTTV